VYASARSLDKLDGLSSGIEKLELDVSRAETITRSVQTILENDGRIDILVNNAGVQCVGEFVFRSPTCTVRY
jgi:1-acylglycerone phosphate reductase